ncbi:MAG: four helix bundle protein [Planctomycetota bacterium]
MIKDFDDLDVYKLSFDLADWIYDLTANFPEDEKYNLVSQLKRAGTSIGANIAEGYGRFHYKENQQFCRQARGSLTECKHHILFSHKRKYVTDGEKELFISRYTILKIKLNNYIKSIGNKNQAASSAPAASQELLRRSQR